MAVASYQLEHFYYGQFARDGAPYGDPRLLARSNGVTQERAESLAEQVTLPPLTGAPDAAWAIVRNKTVPFLMIQAQLGEAGQVMRHYILLQSDVLRGLGGNLGALQQLVEPQMPTYDRLGDDLPPLDLPQLGPPAPESQIDHILDLMTYTHNRTQVIESLLAAVVQGVQIIVQDAPPEQEARVGLVKGLLALLPPPARFGVTFTTHSEPDTALDAQIRFYTEDIPPSDTIVYHWKDALISGTKIKDHYSHFIISQLRLDSQLVIQETQALTSVAAWRIRQGDSLAQALAYGSHRLAVDRAVRNVRPVGIDDVSEILSRDPTLEDDLRRIYASHLLSLSLAMDDMQHADPVAVLFQYDPELEQQARNQLQEALVDGKIELIYNTLVRWLGNPMGPQGREWIDMAHQAALAYMDQLGKDGDMQAINTFLTDVQSVDPGVEINRVVPRLVEMALPLSLRHQPLAQTIFLLAINYLDVDILLNLLKSPRYVVQLPKPFQRAVPYLDGSNPNLAPEGLLTAASKAFGDEWQPPVLIRLAEVAFRANRLDLLDAPALATFVQLASTAWGAQYSDLLKGIVETLSDDTILPTLQSPQPRHLLQILLVLGEYRLLVKESLHQSRTLYPGDLQIMYASMLQTLFADTPLTLADAQDALAALEKGGVRSLPLALARIGVLQRHADNDDVDALAATITDSLFAERTMLDVIPLRSMWNLLRFYLYRQNTAGATRVASLFPEAAATKGNDGIMLMIRMYKTLDKEGELGLAALETLRRYIRQSDTTSARRAIVQFGRELGLKVREALEATYLIKQVMGGVNFIDYAQFMHDTTELLSDNAMAYADKTTPPTLGALVNTMQSLGGGLMDDESQAIAQSVMGLGRSVIVLGDQYRARMPRDADQYIDALVRGEMNPRSGLDVLWIIGGYFARGKRYRMRMRSAPHPLGQRSAPSLREEAEIANRLLRGIIEAFPPDKEVRVTAEAIRGEVESRWGVIDEAMRKDMVRDLAIDFQRLAQLVAYIEENGDPRALQTGGTRKLELGKQQPKSTLEFYRYVYGYFKVK